MWKSIWIHLFAVLLPNFGPMSCGPIANPVFHQAPHASEPLLRRKPRQKTDQKSPGRMEVSRTEGRGSSMVWPRAGESHCGPFLCRLFSPPGPKQRILQGECSGAPDLRERRTPGRIDGCFSRYHPNYDQTEVDHNFPDVTLGTVLGDSFFLPCTVCCLCTLSTWNVDDDGYGLIPRASEG